MDVEEIATEQISADVEHIGDKPEVSTEAETIEVTTEEEVEMETIDDTTDVISSIDVAAEVVEELDRDSASQDHSVSPHVKPVDAAIEENGDPAIPTADMASTEPDVVIEEQDEASSPVIEPSAIDLVVEDTESIYSEKIHPEEPELFMESIEVGGEDEVLPIAPLQEVRADETSKVDAVIEVTPAGEILTIEREDTIVGVEERGQDDTRIVVETTHAKMTEVSDTDDGEHTDGVVIPLQEEPPSSEHTAAVAVNKDKPYSKDDAPSEDQHAALLPIDPELSHPKLAIEEVKDDEKDIELEKDQITTISTQSDSVEGVLPVAQDALDTPLTHELAIKPVEKPQDGGVQIVQEENKVILSAQPPLLEGETANPDFVDFTPIASIAGLENAITVLDSLPGQVALPDTQPLEGEKITLEKDKVEPQAIIIVSTEVINFVAALMEENISIPEFSEQNRESVQGVDENIDQEAITHITVKRDEDKVILGGSTELFGEDQEAPEHSSVSPVTTPQQLSESFAYINSLLVEGENDTHITNKTDSDNSLLPQIEVVMSEEILKFIETIREQTPLLQNTTKETKEVQEPKVTTFSTEGENKKQLTLDIEEFLTIRNFLIENNIIADDDTQEATMFKTDENKENVIVMSQEEIVIKAETSEVVTEAQMSSITVFEMKKPQGTLQEVTKKEQIIPRLVMLKAGEKEIKIDVEVLKKLLKEYQQKKQLNKRFIVNEKKEAPEEVTPGYASFQTGNTMPAAMSYQVIMYLLTLTDKKLSEYEYAVYQQSFLQAA